MSPSTRAFLIIAAIAFITVAGDYFLKVAGSGPSVRMKPLIVGIVIYGLTALGWVYCMRHLNLATLSIVFTLSMVVFAALLGMIVFGERLSFVEIFGILLALSSMALLSRFSS